jgi:hypothetical protein
LSIPTEVGQTEAEEIGKPDKFWSHTFWNVRAKSNAWKPKLAAPGPIWSIAIVPSKRCGRLAAFLLSDDWPFSYLHGWRCWALATRCERCDS